MASGLHELPEHQLLWLFALVIVVFTAIFLKGVIDTHASRDLDITDLEHPIIIKKLLYDPSCLAYEDERINLGFIDLSKFNEDRLNKCLVETENIGMKLTLEFEGNVQQLEINKELTQKLSSCKKGNFNCFDSVDYVIIKSDEGNFGGHLSLELIESK